MVTGAHNVNLCAISARATSPAPRAPTHFQPQDQEDHSMTATAPQRRSRLLLVMLGWFMFTPIASADACADFRAAIDAELDAG